MDNTFGLTTQPWGKKTSSMRHFMMDSTPLVCLHGFWGTGSDFSPLLERLLAQCSVITPFTPDLPGHGITPILAKDCSIENLAHWVADWVQKKRLTRPLLLGYSMGGRIALATALKNPELFSGLVLLSASDGLEDAQVAAERVKADALLATKLRECVSESLLRNFLENWWSNPVFASPRWTSDFYHSFFFSRLEGNPHSLARILEEASVGRQPYLREALTNFRLPTLFLSGTADVRYGKIAQALAATCPTGYALEIPQSGHSLVLENPPELANTLACWLEFQAFRGTLDR